ncbi:hypothetical protein DL96DRAFT_1596820 [Flagelloscypha sp. PMI_526]|nr:hypothetical protein DL96DRAFT_1596820 [Flagelloscypha sp. PMI_526]
MFRVKKGSFLSSYLQITKTLLCFLLLVFSKVTIPWNQFNEGRARGVTFELNLSLYIMEYHTCCVFLLLFSTLFPQHSCLQPRWMSINGEFMFSL